MFGIDRSDGAALGSRPGGALAATKRELDGVVDRLAAQQKGRVASRETATIAGRKARSYRVDYDGKVQEIAFVLEGRREYQLLCRRAADGDGGACRVLRESFEFG